MSGPDRSGFSTRWHRLSPDLPDGVTADVVLEAGWGRIVFGQTFTSAERLRAALRGEESGQRDICIYPREPHVLVAQAPTELFLDPSHTYRLDLATFDAGAADQRRGRPRGPRRGATPRPSTPSTPPPACCGPTRPCCWATAPGRCSPTSSPRSPAPAG